MDLRFTPEELAFRDEVRAFIRDNLPGRDPRADAAGLSARASRTPSPGSAS